MDYTIDIIGSIIDADPVTGDPVPVPGFHVNSIPAIPGLDAYRVEPVEKRRIFAGMADKTVCYRFPDEAAFLAELPDELRHAD